MLQESSNTKKIIVAVVAVLVVVFAIYFFFFRNSDTNELVFDEFGNPVQAQVIGQDLIDLLEDLQSVTLDAAIFQSPLFVNLVDRAIVLSPEAQGRANPFDNLPGSKPVVRKR